MMTHASIARSGDDKRPRSPGASTRSPSRRAAPESALSAFAPRLAEPAPLRLERPSAPRQRKGCSACDESSQKKPCATCGTKTGPSYLERPAGLAQAKRLERSSSPDERQADALGALIGDELAGVGSLGPGPLPSQVRRVAERRLGVSLAGTQLVGGAEGHARAVAERAVAVTEGASVAFLDGHLSTSTSAGRSLLGHELTHVAQQRAAGTTATQRLSWSDLEDFGSGVVSGVGDVASGVYHGVGDVAGGVYHGIGDVAGGVYHGVGDVAGGVYHGVGEVAHGVVTGDPLGGLARGAGAVAGGVVSGVGDVAHGVSAGVNDVVGGVSSGISDVVGGVTSGISTVGGAALRLAGAILGITPSGPVPVGTPPTAPGVTPMPGPGSAPPISTADDKFKGDCYPGRDCDGKILQKRVLHCHNCKKYVSGRSLKRPDGTCEKC